MSCNNNILCQKHSAQVYRGETIVGEFVLKDDEGEVITSVDDLVVLLTPRSNHGASIVISVDDSPTVDGDSITFDEGNMRMVISPVTTKKLSDLVDIEIKVIVNGVVRIVKHPFVRMLDNRVKDY